MGTAEHHLRGEPLPLYEVQKRCYLCGHTWTAPTFVPYPHNQQPLPGTCPKCNVIEEAKVQALVARYVPPMSPVPELRPPVRTWMDDD